MNPYFSVVIPTYNRLPMLERVLGSLGRQRGAPDFEVVVVNDGSTDGTEAALERKKLPPGGHSFPWRFESQKNGGPSRARNRGVEMATGRFVVFIGDDTVPEESFLHEHARIHRESIDDPLLACLGYTGWPTEGRITPFMHHINDFGLQFGYRLIEDGAIVPFNFFYTSNLSLSREVLIAHPFDTSFPAAAWEDIELAYRLDRIGLRIRYNRAAVTRHHHEISVDSFARRQYTAGRSGAIFSSKHPELSHFLGVAELNSGTLVPEDRLERLRWRARLGERFRLLARSSTFDTLMRQHYLRGLRDGLEDLEKREREASAGKEPAERAETVR
jgi:glycosyltransferase involved in cell wall biosynthesis